MADFATRIADFRNRLRDTASRLRAFDERRASTPRAAGKWTPKQILGHLIDSAANNHARFVNAQLKDDLEFPGYEQDAWVRVQRYDARPWGELVDLWLAYNLHLAHVMEHADPSGRTEPRRRHSLDHIAFRTRDVGESVTLEYLMTDYLEHLWHHVGQVLAGEGLGASCGL
jgi:hypothetical protein